MNKMREELLGDAAFGNYYTSAHEADLCQLLNLTPQHLGRITRTCTGMTPTEYINHVRIDKARSYLGFTNLNACEIARHCGFENINYFFRTFKKQTGLTPGEYRKRYKNKDVFPTSPSQF